jgi:hypothetical protein
MADPPTSPEASNAAAPATADSVAQGSLLPAQIRYRLEALRVELDQCARLLEEARRG